MSTPKQLIREKLLQGDLKAAINLLIEFSKNNDSKLFERSIQLSSRYNLCQQAILNGTLSNAEVKITQNEISNSLGILISNLDDSELIKPQVLGGPKGTLSPKTILFLAANPKNSPRMRLDEEIRKIDEALTRGKNRNQLRLVQKWAVQISDLRRALLNEVPQIVHFSGYGSEAGQIYLEDIHGHGTEIQNQSIANLFKLFSETIHCVVLNACYSEAQAEAISKHIEFVIGVSEKIPDQARIEFSEAFYDAIANGREIEFAFNLAKNAIDMHQLLQEPFPVLMRRPQ